MREKVHNNSAFFILAVILLFAVYMSAFSPKAKEKQMEMQNLEEQGFSLVSKTEGLSWNCNDSEYNQNQIITSVGVNLLFVCDSYRNEWYKLCPNGVNASPLGEHDTCK